MENNSIQIELLFHPKEKRFPCTVDDCITGIINSSVIPAYRKIIDIYTYKNVEYYCECYFFVYTDNDATGCCYIQPKCTLLGYHKFDCEGIYVLYDKNTKQPKHVNFSQHTHLEGEWVEWERCTTVGNKLMVYAARGSHANYSYPHTTLRIFGIGNDTTCTHKNGIKKQINKILPPMATTIVRMNADKLREYNMTSFERFIYPLSKNYVNKQN